MRRFLTPAVARLCVVLLLALALPGCRTTRTLSLSPRPDPEAVTYINGHPEMHYRGWVATRADTLLALGMEIRGDRLRVETPEIDKPVDLRLEDVLEIGLLDRKGGFLRSMTAGVGLATGVGLLAAALASPDGPDDRSRTRTGLRAGAITAVFTLPVAFVVGVSGARVIRFQVEAAPRGSGPGR